jgi:malate synthase
MSDLIQKHGLKVTASLSRFIDQEALPGTGIGRLTFWEGFDRLVHDLGPKNRALLAERERLQTALDEWHGAHPGPIADLPAYRGFLESIGYIVPFTPGIQATTQDVDSEIAHQAGPQLVVPLSNLRYALNAANARWGSLYDALYGTDALPEVDGAERRSAFNPVRGAAVIAYGRRLLDEIAPLQDGSHADATHYVVAAGQLFVTLP